MSNTQECAVCCREHGSIDGDRAYVIEEMQLIPYVNKERQTLIHIGICTYCKALMPFDVGLLLAEVDKGAMSGAASDSLVQGLLTRYLTDVWPEESVPSWSVLCNMLNSIGVTTSTNKRWEYHNLAQTAARLGINKELLIGQRLKRTYPERLAALIDSAKDWTAAEFAEPVAQAAAATTNVPPPSQHWQPPVPVRLPEDMPGAKPIDVL